jgi:hypothetical protein
VRLSFGARDCFATEWVMQHINRTGHDRRVPIAIARSARDDNQFVQIATLSLAGLGLTLFLIAQYVGSGVLQQMFAL